MSSTKVIGNFLAAGVAVIAVGLVLWQAAERRRRGTELSAEDLSHFALQDVRRWVVAVVMLLLSAGLSFGSTMNPRWPAGPNPNFVLTWLGVFVLILALMVLALLDWLATRRYAWRHRSEIVREGMQILRDEIRLRASRRRNETAAGGNGDGLTP